MNVKKWLLVVVCLVPGLVFGVAENSPTDNVKNIVSREGGYHAIFLKNSVFLNTDGCSLNDRAVLANTVGENKAMYTLALSAMLSGAKVELRTDGCIEVQAGAANTAPRLIKVKIYPPE